MALNGMFVEAASVTADQQWRTDTSAEWRDGPINLGAMRFQPTQIVEVRDRPIPPEVQAWGPDDRSDAALRSGRWEVSPRSDVSGDTPTQIRFVRPGSEHNYSTLSAKDVVGSHPFEAWRTILAALFRPRPVDPNTIIGFLYVMLVEEGGHWELTADDIELVRSTVATNPSDPMRVAYDLFPKLSFADRCSDSGQAERTARLHEAIESRP